MLKFYESLICKIIFILQLNQLYTDSSSLVLYLHPIKPLISLQTNWQKPVFLKVSNLYDEILQLVDDEEVENKMEQAGMFKERFQRTRLTQLAQIRCLNNYV